MGLLLRALLVMALAAAAWAPAAAATTAVTVPTGAIAGLSEQGPAPRDALLRLAIELQPRADLDDLAARVADPANSQHRLLLSAEAFDARFGRVADGRALGALLRAERTSNVFVSRSGLVVSTIVTIEQAEHLFGTRWLKYGDAHRSVLAPAGPLQVPAAGVRDVRGAVAATTPRLNQARAPTTGFRGDWYLPVRFREMYDALPDGGANQRIVLVEDASDGFDVADVRAFVSAEGAPPGADPARVREERYAFKAPSQDCGRDDRGQEAPRRRRRGADPRPARRDRRCVR
jgi:hypothetical protein